MIADKPIGHAPTPAPSSSWAMNTIKVVTPQIIHENTCGLTFPDFTDLIYG